MKKKFAALMVVALAATLFAGCGKETPAETASKDAVKALTDLTVAQQKLGNLDPNDPASAAKVMETYANLGAQMELQEFEKAEAVDPPSNFPSALIYSKGKITESSDDGDESYINKEITIKTTEDIKTVKEFYKTLFAQPTWKLTSQSSESGGASYKAKDSANIEASVDISVDAYSKLVNVRIWYNGDITS
ncbi:MAG: hypothetical protein WCT53_03000 [Candidatus Gracilibacteria bacterium]|jgi:predicted small lipoprotein YifL